MYLDIVEGTIDENVQQLIIKKEDGVVAFTLTNTGNVNFYYSPSIILFPGDVKTIGGSNLVPFHINRTVKFANSSDLKSVVIEKIILRND